MMVGVWGREQQMEEEDGRGNIAKPFLSAGPAPSSSTLEVLYVNFAFTSKCFVLLRPEPS